MNAKLVLTLNSEVISEHEINGDETTIGRRFANDIHIDNLGVSGSHAKVVFFGNDAFIEDLNSTNGTFINGARIEKQLLKDNDVITIGKYQLQYKAGAKAEQDEFEQTVILKPDDIRMEPTGSAAKAEAEKPTAASGQAKLIVASGPSQGKSMQLAKTVTRLGKPGQQSSAIAKRPQGYFFVNLGGEGMPTPSLNGKKLSVGATRLNESDLITIGNIELRFSLN